MVHRAPCSRAPFLASLNLSFLLSTRSGGYAYTQSSAASVQASLMFGGDEGIGGWRCDAMVKYGIRADYTIVVG